MVFGSSWTLRPSVSSRQCSGRTFHEPIRNPRASEGFPEDASPRRVRAIRLVPLLSIHAVAGRFGPDEAKLSVASWGFNPAGGPLTAPASCTQRGAGSCQIGTFTTLLARCVNWCVVSH